MRSTPYSLDGPRTRQPMPRAAAWRTPGLLVVACAAANTASALTIVPTDEDYFLESLRLVAQVRACEASMPGFASRIEPDLAGWRTRYADRIAAGREALRAESTRAGVTVERDADDFRAAVYARWRGYPAATLRAECDRLQQEHRGERQSVPGLER